MHTLDDAVEIGGRERYLAVVSTVRGDATIQSSVVNVGLITHPTSGKEVLAFVTYGRTKLANLRRRNVVTVTYRSGGEWMTVEGNAELIGPDDAHPRVDGERLRLLRREIFAAAGGVHGDWNTYDRVMDEQRRAAVLVHPSRIYSNRHAS